ncbi:PAS domain-containing protein, partial [Streptomyces aureus]|uniref:PAS domain-containing protein n=1 Tax=Streptomyces aureus TaxID=193461 RepID=UPI0034050AFE
MSVGTGGAQSALRARDARGPSASRLEDPATAPGPGLGIDPDDLPDGIVVADEHGRVVCFNAAAARITATPAAEALGRGGAAAPPPRRPPAER